MRHYYNEWEPYCAAWLRNLMAAGLIPKGDVDERDMRTIKAADLKGYTSCHFFAGLGGWAYALRLAGWPDSRPVWTGSCPCQPFSCAGKGLGEADERHLWPEFRRLIGERRPAVCFGEQVASAAGRVWLAGVRVDLEALAYAVGGADLCAAGVGAPGIRQRLWWVADACSQRRQQNSRSAPRNEDRRLADAAQRGQQEHGSAPGHAGHADEREQAGGVGNPKSHNRRAEQPTRSAECRRGRSSRASTTGRLDEPDEQRRATSTSTSTSTSTDAEPDGAGGASDGLGNAERGRQFRHDGRRTSDEPAHTGFWSAFDLIPCADGKARRAEPGTFPLAHGVPARVGKLRAYGNAIVPQVAAEFVKAYLEATEAV